MISSDPRRHGLEEYSIAKAMSREAMIRWGIELRGNGIDESRYVAAWR